MVGFGDPLGDGKAKAGAAHIARAGFVRTEEAVEDAGERAGLYAAPLVHHSQLGGTTVSLQVNVNGGAGIAVLDRVVEENGDELAEAGGVAAP